MVIKFEENLNTVKPELKEFKFCRLSTFIYFSSFPNIQFLMFFLPHIQIQSKLLAGLEINFRSLKDSFFFPFPHIQVHFIQV